MRIETIPVGPFEVNCYVAWGPSLAALVVDPGADAARIRARLLENKLSVAAYLITHGHVDHVSALADLHDEFPAPIAMHADDFRWAFTPANELPPFYAPPRTPARVARIVADGQEWEDAGMKYRIVATPGHSPGGVCFHFPGEAVLFAGDTLFQGSVGRTDIPGGDPRILSASIATLARLPDETRVYPGHGPSTTIGIEKRQNFFMRGKNF